MSDAKLSKEERRAILAESERLHAERIVGARLKVIKAFCDTCDALESDLTAARAELAEFNEMLEGMKEGVSIRIADIEKERDAANGELARLREMMAGGKRVWVSMDRDAVSRTDFWVREPAEREHSDPCVGWIFDGGCHIESLPREVLGGALPEPGQCKPMRLIAVDDVI